MTHLEDEPPNTGNSFGSLPGDSAEVVTNSPASAPTPPASIPQDLRISWSWLHFIIFFLFSFGSLLIIQLASVVYLASYRHLPMKEVERLLTTNARFAVVMQIVWFGFVLLFLYVTLSLLKDAPFWSTLGWRRLPDPPSVRSRVWPYFFGGCGLSALVAFAGVGIHPKEKMPIEDLFKDPHSALLLMALAVLIAPLMEETLFRGYLYPLLARNLGVLPGIFLTGLLFGLMHGYQLGWTLGLVALLTIVGWIFTYVRARTGTVFASYLMHLGYNAMLAVSYAVATKGFQHMPTPR